MLELTWRSRLTVAEAGEAGALLDAAMAADGIPPVSEATRLRLRPGVDAEDASGGPAVHLLGRVAGELAGYAFLDATQVSGVTGELAVHPRYRRRGVGAELVRALISRGQGARLRLWAHGRLPAAQRLARRHGFTEARVLRQMRRSLLAPPLAAPRLPADVVLRPFVVGQDEAAFVEVNNKAFAWHPEQGSWDVEQVRLREAQPWFDAEGFLLAVDHSADRAGTAGDGIAGGRIVGFHWTKIHTAEVGEVYVLGVDPGEQGRGLGGALTLAGLRYLRGRGMSTVLLYVEADNAAAVRTYRRLGFTNWSTDVSYQSP